ncbi:DUF1501 domain-containing protein [Planctomycetales bacterium ZRK34]|nr:DUF1501 domain-containing protein [Planctomycetales bacterium ZRK34]
MLRQCGAGFGSVALAAMLGHEAFASTGRTPFAPSRPHFTPRARNVIFLYMDGGPSQVDTFDPKPTLKKYDGKPFPVKAEPTQFDNNGNTLASPWKFHRYGQSGTPVSDLFPHVGRCIDDIAVIRSMTSDFSEHTNANYFLHTGVGLQGRPSMGAWVGYGLGSECRNLPSFVVLNGGLIPPGGLDNFNSGFLPATYQGSIFKAGAMPVANIKPTEPSAAAQQRKLALMHDLDAGVADQFGRVDAIESAIANYELAFRMQMAVPNLMDLSDESKPTQRLYGLESSNKPTQIFGRQCLIARRLVERGVRFIELTCPSVGHDRWDQHGNLKDGHEKNAVAVDQPIAGLLRDLKQRGLLDETLIVWSGEFGRTPFAQGKNGRDHNPFGYSMWLAGGGVRGGVVHGATDDLGYKAVEHVRTIHDLHATILHLLGIDHEKLTVRFGGLDQRLTTIDHEAHVIHDVIA